MNIEQIIEIHKEMTETICDSLYDSWNLGNSFCAWENSDQCKLSSDRKKQHEEFVKRIESEGITK